ncbi:hypothetical protein HZB58_03555 [Candidatus Gottesmanbacteria bacterium]|nr:hypothetical protein [Candidatus Gottesmanbacteria bacterium]
MAEGGKDVKIVDESRALHDHYEIMRKVLIAGPNHPDYDRFKSMAMNHRKTIESMIGGEDKALEFAAQQIIKRLPEKKFAFPRIGWRRK